jgi:hypothetical protein
MTNYAKNLQKKDHHIFHGLLYVSVDRDLLSPNRLRKVQHQYSENVTFSFVDLVVIFTKSKLHFSRLIEI